MFEIKHAKCNIGELEEIYQSQPETKDTLNS